MSPIDWVATRATAIGACHKLSVPDEDDVAQAVCLKLMEAGYEDASAWLIFEMVKQVRVNSWRKEHDIYPLTEAKQRFCPEAPVEELMDTGKAIRSLPRRFQRAIFKELTRRRNQTAAEKVVLSKARKALKEALA